MYDHAQLGFKNNETFIGILDALQQPQVENPCSMEHRMMTVTGLDMNRNGIHSGFCICALVYNIWKMQESSNYDSRLAVVYTDFLLFLVSTC